MKKTFFCFLTSVLAAGEIRQAEIKPILEEIFSYHVDEHAFTPKIAQRSFRNYLMRFDPGFRYFVAQEVHAALLVENSLWEEVVDKYQAGDFAHYFALNGAIVKSIARAQEMRKQIREMLVEKKELKKVSVERDCFCKTEEELYRQWAEEMESFLISYAREKGVLDLNREERLKVLEFYEKKKGQHEEIYTSFEKRPLQILKAIASGLDAHTMCYSEEEAGEIRKILQKEFCGVGIHLKESVEGPLISHIVPHSPAEASGRIQVGDIIREIDGQSTDHLYFKKILNNLVGAPHSTVSLLVEGKEGLKEPIVLSREKLTLEEERIRVEYEPFANGIIGVVTLSSFYDNGEGVSVEQDLRQALSELKAMGPLNGLVLDMRSNAGGFLHQAVKISGLFLQKGTVVIAKYANDEVRFTKNQDLKLFYQGPIVVLVSKASASAAEIVCQTLQDEGVAVIVGDERTYGKGSMQYQTITDAEAKHFYKVTVGRYFTLSGKSPQIEGVKSDIVVPTLYSALHLGEKYLAYPLSAESMDAKGDIGQELKKMFAQYRAQPLTTWQKMTPLLSQNSSLRKENDRNLQLFCKQLQDSSLPLEAKRNGCGSEDLQKREAINIVKDMIFLAH